MNKKIISNRTGFLIAIILIILISFSCNRDELLLTKIEPHLYTQHDNIVAAYFFNGNATDSSKFDNHGTTNHVSLSAGRHGNRNEAYKFWNTFIGYIEIPYSSSLKIENERTVAFWIYPKSWNGISGILCQAPGNKILADWNNRIKWELYVHNAPTNLSLTSDEGFITINEWQFICVTLRSDETGTTVSFYKNGNFINSAYQNTFIPEKYDNYLIGATHKLQYGYFLDCILDELYIFDKKFGVQEIEDLYNYTLVN